MAMERPIIDRYASPECLAQVSAAPLAVCELVFLATGGDRQHLALLRKDHRGDETTSRERYAIAWIARTYAQASFPEIGRALSCDHSAVIRGFHQALRLRGADREFLEMSERLLDQYLAARVQNRPASRQRAVRR